MNWRSKNYTNIKTVFENIKNNIQNIDISLSENRDALALKLSYKNDITKVDYYYVYGNSQVYRFINDNDYKVLTINPENLERHILIDIENFIKNKEIY